MNYTTDCAKYELLPIGSYALGVTDNESDLDLVMIVDTTTPREKIFDQFEELLNSNPEVKSVLVLKEATIPIIKFIHEQVPVDI